MKHLIKNKNKWKLTNKDIKNKDKIVIKPGDLFIIFTYDNMQVFSYEKEMQRLYLKENEKNYNFAGKVFGKGDDIYVYKRKKIY